MAGATATTTGWTSTSINATVPTTLAAGSTPVVVTVGSYGSNTVSGNVNSPVLSSLSSTSGSVGSTININGVGFGDTSATLVITLGSVVASQTGPGHSGTLITIKIPNPGHPGTYPITVSVNGSPSNSLNYTVI